VKKDSEGRSAIHSSPGKVSRLISWVYYVSKIRRGEGVAVMELVQSFGEERMGASGAKSCQQGRDAIAGEDPGGEDQIYPQDRGERRERERNTVPAKR